MALKPIPGAPSDAAVPDFPTGEPGPLLMPESGADRPVRGALPFPFSPPVPVPTTLPVQRSGPHQIRGPGDSMLVLEPIAEIPAISRSRMIVSVTGDPTGVYSSYTMPLLDLPTDRARAFLMAMRDAQVPVVAADSRSGFRLEFAVAGDGPAFSVSKPGQEATIRRFKVGPNFDVRAMAVQLLAELGP